MALDGIMIAALTKELSDKLAGGRLIKIAQPESDELLITVKNEKGQHKLKLSASASLPYAALVETNKQSPLSAPNFCMLLRKHLSNGRIVDISQPGLERAINITVEHLDEMGDLCKKTLIIELMGKHSNIILVNSDNLVLDSIKHISAMISSVREVLPGKEYFIPDSSHKLDPLSLSYESFRDALCSKPMSISKAIYSAMTGFSPVIASELIYRAGTDPDIPAPDYSDESLKRLYAETERLISGVEQGEFELNIIYDDKQPVEFCATHLSQYRDLSVKAFDSASEVLNTYYSEKDSYTRMRQKTSDLRKIVKTHLEKDVKKLDLLSKQFKDTDKMDRYKLWGELINTYGYNLEEGAKVLHATDYHNDTPVEIPLDKDLSPRENAKKYFDRYTKLKRTREAVSVQLSETETEVEHLSTVLLSLELIEDEAALSQIKEELIESGYIRRHDLSAKKDRKKAEKKSRPFHYVSSDGYDIYVGKNNFQNDQLTFGLATGDDWWFHAKKIPGSHVILKNKGTEIPDRAFEEAGALAAFYSKGRDQNKVEVDYVEKKQVKKPAGGKPGFVIYYTNYSMAVAPDISALALVDTES